MLGIAAGLVALLVTLCALLYFGINSLLLWKLAIEGPETRRVLGMPLLPAFLQNVGLAEDDDLKIGIHGRDDTGLWRTGNVCALCLGSASGPPTGCRCYRYAGLDDPHRTEAARR